MMIIIIIIMRIIITISPAAPASPAAAERESRAGSQTGQGRVQGRLVALELQGRLPGGPRLGGVSE